MIMAMKKQIHYIYITLLFALLGTQVFAQRANQTHIVHLKSAELTLPQNGWKWLDSMTHVAASNEPVQVLVHFNELPTAQQKDALKQSGITLYDYIPDNTYTAFIQLPVNTSLLNSVSLYSIVQMKAEWKADDYLWRKVNAQEGAVEVLVTFFKDIDSKAVRQFITDAGGRIDNSPLEQYNNYKVIIAAGKVKYLAAWYGVKYISPVTSMVPLDLQSRPAVKGNVAVSPVTYGGYDLLGDGVTVGVGDNTSGIFHADIKDRINNFNPAAITHHGEHVNGIVGGAAIVDPLAEGMAPHVNLVDYYFDLILPATGSMLNDYNMTITNNSYAVIEGDCSYAGTYDAYAVLMDTIAIQYPAVQHVFASGNDGALTCTPYPFGYATVAGGYQPAKNALVVSNMKDDQSISIYGSHGPVKDGRLKPELVAVGTNVYSTIDIDGYEYADGTSMASPQVAGGLALLTEKYKQLNFGAQPSAAVLRSMLLNGASDLGNPGPDFIYGYGAMNVYRSMLILNGGHYFEGSVANGAVQSFPITVPANTAQLKVLVCWNDMPASPASSKQLVNDLDLTVKDPGLATHKPWVLDPTPANVNNNAIQNADHLNNVEQVTIDNPAAGNYSMTVFGFSVPSGPQAFAISYDIVSKGLQLTYPIGGEKVSNADSMRIFWDGPTDGNTFTVQFSSNGGSTWTTLSATVDASLRHYSWMPSGFNSGNCMARVLRNGTSQQSTSAAFAINTQPVLQIDSLQCPGYVNVHWSPIPNATSYQMLCKRGPYMQVVDTVTDTAYSFGALNPNIKNYVAVSPIINGLAGYRSIAAIRIPNDGSCLTAASVGDIRIDKIILPKSGRMFTSSQLSSSELLGVKVRNLYQADCNNYTLSYSINGGMWQTLVNPDAIPADTTIVISVPGLDLATPGTYAIRTAIHNLSLTDPQPGNDSLNFTVLSLPNAPIDLATPFVDDFESMPVFTATDDSVGVSPNGHWDFVTANDTGRLRSLVSDSVVISGIRSISMDESQATITSGQNNFIGTFNLGTYDTANTEVRMDFDYMLSGSPKNASGNNVQARGMDTKNFAPLYTYDLNATPGVVNHAKSLSVTDALRLSGQNFSTSTQINFGQSDTSVIAQRNYGNGLTIDNFALYSVTNDAELTSIVSPAANGCGLPSSVPLTVQVHNGVNYTLHNVHLFYQLDGGAVFAGTIDSLKPKDTVNYTFSQQLSIGTTVSHTLNVWLTETGDTYNSNDSILNFTFRNNQIISNYPYLENFEAGNGGFYTDGINDSWQYGTPASQHINKAASGTKAWKTNLTGHYNNMEHSYLYTPCFDIASLTNPMLSFSLALDVENCGGSLCDQAYIEYSFDGASWSKLGAEGQGTNWYDNAINVWNTQGFYRWHVASMPLPQPPAGQAIRFRIALSSDPGGTYEGVGVDDVHIFDKVYSIFPADSSTSILQDATANQWTNYIQSNQLLAQIQPGSAMPKTAVTLYGHNTLYNTGATQYTFPRSYLVQAAENPADSALVKLYLLESDVVSVLEDTTCPSCTRFPDAYTLGITKYDNNNNKNAENGTLADDTGGVYTYYPYKQVTWVPYDQGYEAQISATSFSELWFNNGGPTGNFAAGNDYLNFVAIKGSSNVTLFWTSFIDTAVVQYILQRSDDGVNFNNIHTATSKDSTPGQYTYIDTPAITPTSPVYYRLTWNMSATDSVCYSPICKVDYNDSTTNLVTFEANRVSSQNVLADWTSYIDGIVSYYTLERAIESGGYSTIGTTTSLQHYGQKYYETDAPGNPATGTKIHYRLTATLFNGTQVVLPIQTVEWTGAGAIANIYPNPNTDGTFNIVWHADAGTTMEVNITDAVGKSMYDQTFTSTTWNNVSTLHTFRNPKGVYYLRMKVGSIAYQAKMVYE